ncbi:class II fumarate hydratase [uncultured Aquimonas sp.]|mgnify:CR=1 FL=1|uniref:class II fumarate hydratase n=1 Tax=uncultured Aquimonas sp. TaxID=385483 RepID=UPI00086C0ED9|nr:class II fumarate hydratase [uncultured Aquimonas sp.]ODU48132.1 MAG: aspartate ammonia-lyase [Xanthomonadaceae bacterium SCN 69-123]
MAKPRIERDSLGELEVPDEALWGAQTQRAVQNFPISGQRMPAGFIRALALIKSAAARANADLGLLDAKLAEAIESAAAEVAEGGHAEQFPVDVFQTGSGTSSNMNINEVLAALAKKRLRKTVSPNDHVNMAQSSNDAVPSAIQVSAALALRDQLLPALKSLKKTIGKRADELADVPKTGRTHLMDAMPLSFGQELGAWAAQLASARERIEQEAERLRLLPLSGTAIGTGINAHPHFGKRACRALQALTGIKFRPADNLFAGIAGQDAALGLSAQLNGLAAILMKIANDLRWMNSGPLAGLGEIELPTLQPGSSIMPGKVNPVIPEAVAMVCAQVMGAHVTVTVAAQSGSFQLNVMLPLIAHSLLQSIELLSNAMRLLGERAIAGFRVRADHIDEALARNPILVTALNPVIGYAKGAEIAKRAYAEGRPLIDVAEEVSGLPRAQLVELLDPRALTRGGLKGGGSAGG